MKQRASSLGWVYSGLFGVVGEGLVFAELPKESEDGGLHVFVLGLLTRYDGALNVWFFG